MSHHTDEEGTGTTRRRLRLLAGAALAALGIVVLGIIAWLPRDGRGSEAAWQGSVLVLRLVGMGALLGGTGYLVRAWREE